MEANSPEKVVPVVKGVPVLLVVLLVGITSVISLVIGFVVSRVLLPPPNDNTANAKPTPVITEEDEDVNDDEEDVSNDDPAILTYIAKPYGFMFNYPEYWTVEPVSDPLYQGAVEVVYGEYKIVMDIMTYPDMGGVGGWGPEPCLYADSVGKEEIQAGPMPGMEYDNFVTIDAENGSFRRSQTTDVQQWTLCGAGLDNEENIYSIDSFAAVYGWEEGNTETPLTGFVSYTVPDNASEDKLNEMDWIMASMKMVD